MLPSTLFSGEFGMNRFCTRMFVGMATLIFCLPLAAQTIADRARDVRKDKRTTTATDKVYTNESLNLRAPAAISEPTSAGKKDAKKGDEAADGEEDAAKEKELSPDEQKAKAAAEFKDKIEKAKGELTQLQRELDVAQRENRLRTAVYYADAGSKLRDERKFADDDRKIQADFADKQKKIGDLQQTLDKLRDGARRAGVPAGLIP
jgi:hypothetical protein